jgi:hypothetical protein
MDDSPFENVSVKTDAESVATARGFCTVCLEERALEVTQYTTQLASDAQCAVREKPTRSPHCGRRRSSDGTIVNKMRYNVVKVTETDGRGGSKESFRIRDTEATDPFDMLLKMIFSTEELARATADELNHAAP